MSTAPSHPSPTRPRLEDARRALLDLSRRNRLLNFKPRGHGSLAIVDELPEHVYRILVDDAQTMQFLPVEEAPAPESIAAEQEEEAPHTPTPPPDPAAPADAEPHHPAAPPDLTTPSPAATTEPEPPPPPPDLQPPPAPTQISTDTPPHTPALDDIGDTAAALLAADHAADHAAETTPPPIALGEIEETPAPEPAAPAEEETPAERHTDRRLQTNLPGPKLQDRLLHLSRQAESALEEQGANILFLTLGLVEWVDATGGGSGGGGGGGGETRSHAPLLLIPVELTRRSIRGRHALKHSGDDPVVNPTLLELCKRNFRLALPAFDPDAENPVETYFARLEDTLAPINGWSLRREIHLGLFSFAKLLMYLDLDDVRWPADRAVSNHRLIGALLGSTPLADGDSALPPLPDPKSLDNTLAPTDTFQVVDADSSQQAAIVAAKEGRSLVIEGPPGTGKSQTITNIIAECLAEGKTVLFVAEKAAALEVVKGRLERVGLGDFVAELHSRKANKRAFMEDLQRSLARDHAPPTNRKLLDADRLADLRKRLNDYVAALHTPVDPLGLTPYAVIGRIATVATAPELPFIIPDITAWDLPRLHRAEEALSAAAQAAERVGDPMRHPWRGVGLMDVPLTVRQQVPALVESLIASAQRLRDTATELDARLHLRAPQTTADSRALIDLAQAILADPEVDPAHARNPAYDSFPATLLHLLATGRRLTQLRADLAPRWNTGAAETIDWTLTAQRRATPPGFLGRLLSGDWRRDTALIRTHLKPPTTPADPAIPADLTKLIEARRLRDELLAASATARELLGPLWQDDRTDWDAAERYARAVVRLRSILLDARGTSDTLTLLTRPDGRAALKDITHRLTTHLTSLLDTFTTFSNLTTLDPTTFLGAPPDSAPLPTWTTRLAESRGTIESLPDWTTLNRAHHTATESGLTPFLTAVGLHHQPLPGATGGGSAPPVPSPSPEPLPLLRPPLPLEDYASPSVSPAGDPLVQVSPLPHSAPRGPTWGPRSAMHNPPLGEGRGEGFPSSLPPLHGFPSSSPSSPHTPPPIPTHLWPQAFLRQFYRLWLDETTRTRPALSTFRGEDHERLIDRFREVDRQWLEVSRQRLCAQIHERRPRVGFATSESSGLGILEREIRRKRGIRPIRQLLASPAGPAIQRIKPCFMMSPLSVAQFLEPAALRFDVVIFDEASQVEPADALGAIARAGSAGEHGQAGQVILVGDEKQLPPTNFFSAIGAATDDFSSDPDDESATASAADLESILGLAQASIPARTRLRWHYRSRHQSLIDFSNREFYDHDLRVFPSPFRGGDTHGLSFRHIENSVYLRGRGQHNPVEARAVAQAVIDHARATPELSLGVAALNVRQQNAIQDELERLRRELDDPDVERFFAADREEVLFVKNLETVQGDERDVMFLSIGFGRDDAGRLTMNFGPINQEGGWRRLNVLITRARQRCTVFSSIRPEEIRADENTPRGVRALKNYLHFALTGAHDHTTGVRGDHDSPFEAEVARALLDRNWDVQAQIGSAGFWIDLGIVDPQSPGRYLAGIECDGATYHSSATARDRDRLRQSVLEGLGWTILRIWSTDWFHQPTATLERLHAQLTHLATRRPKRPPSGGPSPRPAPPSPPEASDAPSTTDADSAPAIPPGLVPYERYQPSRRLAGKPISEQTQRTLATLLAEAVAAEGPIHKDELYRLTARHLDSRLVQSAVAALDSALASAQEESRITRRGDFLWPPAMTAAPLRWRAVEDAVTDPALIAPEEAAHVAAYVAHHEFGVPEADLPAATVRAMGLRRVTEPALRLARAGVDLALATNLITRDDRGLCTAPTGGEPPTPPSPAV